MSADRFAGVPVLTDAVELPLPHGEATEAKPVYGPGEHPTVRLQRDAPPADAPVSFGAFDEPEIDLGDVSEAAPRIADAPAAPSPVRLLDEPLPVAAHDAATAEAALSRHEVVVDLSPEIDEDELVRRITGDVQKQIDLMFEYRLREALVPTLARISDMLIRETRLELALTLRDVVARAVAQEVARHRSR